MMVKEDLSFRRRSEFSSMTANRDEKDDEIVSFTSDSSNDSNYENVNHANSTHLADDKLESSFQKVILDTKQKSHNRQRRKSFLTGKNDSSFSASPFLTRRVEANEKHSLVIHSPYNSTNVTAKDISEQESSLRKQIKQQSTEKSKQNITRLFSKGSDMSLTLGASQEEMDSCPMFTQVFTQNIKHPNHSETSHEVSMEDADSVSTVPLTQSHSKYSKIDDICSDDESDGMFSQQDTQLHKNEKSNEIIQSDNSSTGHSTEMHHKEFQQPSFQNFSSGSAKAALKCLAADEKSKDDAQTRSTESSSNLSEQQNNEQVIGSSENSSETGENSPLDINEEEELAVSIMTQAFSEAISDGNGELSQSAKSDYQNLDEHTNEHLPATQPSFHVVLEGVVAYVEVRTANENRSACVISRLESIGAKVSEFLNTTCTHLVFKDGSLSTYNKAKKLGLYIVSVTWIEACRNDCTRLPEANYPCSNRERYEAPGLFPKLRKAKSMQPKPEEDFIRALNSRINRKEKAKQRTEEKAKAAQKAEKDRLYNPFTYRVRHPFPDHYYNSPNNDASLSNKNVLINKPSVLEMLKEYDNCITSDNVMSPTFIEFTSPSKPSGLDCDKSANEGKCHVPETPSPCRSDDLNTPLFKRIAERINRKNSSCHIEKVVNKQHSSHKKKEYPRLHSNKSISKVLDERNNKIMPDDENSYKIKGLQNSPNSSPIARNSYFFKNATSNEPTICPKTGSSDKYHQNDSIKVQSNSKDTISIVRTRSETRKSLLVSSKTQITAISESSKNKIVLDKPSKNRSNYRSQSDISEPPQLSAAKSIVRTRSSINNSSRKLSSKDCSVKENVKTHKSPKKNNVLQKKRRILFSDQSSLLAESPTGLTQEINWKIPSPPKNTAKTRKSVAPQLASKSSTKIVRSESGSLLYAEPPKSNVAPNKRQPRRSQANSRTVKSNQVNSKGNPDGSYGQDEFDYFGCGSVDSVERNKDIKRTILPSRRSTAEFQSPLRPVTRKRSSKINLIPIAEEIVFTSCTKDDIDLARQLTKTYSTTTRIETQSGSQSSNSSENRVISCKAKPRTIRIASNGKVTDETTHVVCGNSTELNSSSQCSSSSQSSQQPTVRRTINVLKGILRGCWILSVNWLYASLEHGCWAEEEMFELVDFSPAVKSMRLEKEAFFSPSYGIKFCSVSDLLNFKLT